VLLASKIHGFLLQVTWNLCPLQPKYQYNPGTTVGVGSLVLAEHSRQGC
jgi:hypothetical protein